MCSTCAKEVQRYFDEAGELVALEEFEPNRGRDHRNAPPPACLFLVG